MGALCAEKYEVGVINLQKKESAENILLFDPRIKNSSYFRPLLGQRPSAEQKNISLNRVFVGGQSLSLLVS